jgi:hypothetical protein
MVKTDEPEPNRPGEESTDSKAELQQRMDEARESISQTVEEIKETVEGHISSVRETVSSVLFVREQFQRDPVAWSLGALSAGFAIGYTLGYAHKHARSPGRPRSPLAAFADDLAGELAAVGKNLVLPSLDAQIKSSFGFDLTTALEEIAGARKPTAKPRTRRSRRPPPARRTRRKTRSRS